MGRLTTHILNTAEGIPAAGVPLQLFSIDPVSGLRTHLCSAVSNADGRTDAPLLADAALVAGVYELVFQVGDYFAGRASVAPSDPSRGPAFLDIIPLRFGIADAASHYHVPLLVSPWSYSTYRGS